MQAYDQAVQLSPLIQRLVAPNPSAMTGPGTNTYFVGTDDLALIDPGPAIDEHIDHILKVAEGRISHILCTHTHPDHSPAAAPLGFLRIGFAPFVAIISIFFPGLYIFNSELFAIFCFVV